MEDVKRFSDGQILWDGARMFPGDVEIPRKHAETLLRLVPEIEDWIYKNCIPRKTFNEYCSSYGLKHYLQHDTGIYLYNGEFKGVMHYLGFEAHPKYKQNHVYKIKKINGEDHKTLAPWFHSKGYETWCEVYRNPDIYKKILMEV